MFMGALSRHPPSDTTFSVERVAVDNTSRHDVDCRCVSRPPSASIRLQRLPSMLPHLSMFVNVNAGKIRVPKRIVCTIGSEASASTRHRNVNIPAENWSRCERSHVWIRRVVRYVTSCLRTGVMDPLVLLVNGTRCVALPPCRTRWAAG